MKIPTTAHWTHTACSSYLSTKSDLFPSLSLAPASCCFSMLPRGIRDLLQLSPIPGRWIYWGLQQSDADGQLPPPHGKLRVPMQCGEACSCAEGSQVWARGLLPGSCHLRLLFQRLPWAGTLGAQLVGSLWLSGLSESEDRIFSEFSQNSVPRATKIAQAIYNPFLMLELEKNQKSRAWQGKWQWS